MGDREIGRSGDRAIRRSGIIACICESFLCGGGHAPGAMRRGPGAIRRGPCPMRHAIKFQMRRPVRLMLVSMAEGVREDRSVSKDSHSHPED
jgi:hypothetical protein